MPNTNQSNMLPQGSVLDGRYEIERHLGSGGFGNTYIARDLKFRMTKTRVAVKEFFISGATHRAEDGSTVVVSNPDNRSEFERLRSKFKEEAERLFALHHPHIVRVSDTFDTNATSYYVMDYIEGLSLSATIRQQGHPFCEKEALRYIRETLDALSVVHQQGIYHLDIKPGNIMLDSRGHAVLIDFGASKMLKEGGHTLSSTVLYTKGYAPSEQIYASVKKIGPWTDLYAVGATLFHLLTGKEPPTPVEIADDGLERSMPLPGISSHTREAIYTFMQQKTYDRPQNVEDALALLGEETQDEQSQDTRLTDTMQPQEAPAFKDSTVINEELNPAPIISDTVISNELKTGPQVEGAVPEEEFVSVEPSVGLQIEEAEEAKEEVVSTEPEPELQAEEVVVSAGPQLSPQVEEKVISRQAEVQPIMSVKPKHNHTWIYVSIAAICLGIALFAIGFALRKPSKPQASPETPEVAVSDTSASDSVPAAPVTESTTAQPDQTATPAATSSTPVATNNTANTSGSTATTTNTRRTTTSATTTPVRTATNTNSSNRTATQTTTRPQATATTTTTPARQTQSTPQNTQSSASGATTTSSQTSSTRIQNGTGRTFGGSSGSSSSSTGSSRSTTSNQSSSTRIQNGTGRTFGGN